MNVGSSLHQQFDGLAEAVPGHLMESCVAILTGQKTKSHIYNSLTDMLYFVSTQEKCQRNLHL